MNDWGRKTPFTKCHSDGNSCWFVDFIVVSCLGILQGYELLWLSWPSGVLLKMILDQFVIVWNPGNTILIFIYNIRCADLAWNGDCPKKADVFSKSHAFIGSRMIFQILTCSSGLFTILVKWHCRIHESPDVAFIHSHLSGDSEDRLAKQIIVVFD